MRKETYIKMTQPFRENPKLAKSLHMANKILTGLVFIAYQCLLTFLAKQACVFRNYHCTYIFPGQYAAGNRIACMCGRDCGDPCDFRRAQYQ